MTEAHLIELNAVEHKIFDLLNIAASVVDELASDTENTGQDKLQEEVRKFLRLVHVSS